MYSHHLDSVISILLYLFYMIYILSIPPFLLVH